MRKPFILIVVGHFAGHSSTLTGMRSYLIEILRTMQIPIKPQLFTASCTLVVKVIRKLYELF